MPSIIKPASQTAYLTELMVRRMIETGLLPEGALQLISGSLGDMLDHVTCQDVVTFTGSAATGRMLKTRPAIIDHSVRFTMEADSLNAAVLGHDAGPGTAEFDLFVREVVREMTSKAGQKCTAIRRVIVPVDHADAIVAALADKLGKTVLGDPRDENVRMGPLASTGQRDEVRGRIGELAREAEIVCGHPEEATTVSGDAEGRRLPQPGAAVVPRPGRRQRGA